MSDDLINDEVISSNISAQKKLSEKRQQDTKTRFFKEILSENGVILSRNDRAHVLTKEQSLVIRDIEKVLTENDIEDNTARFISGFKTCCKKTKFLHVSLLSTALRKGPIDDSEDSMSYGIHQESLIKILFHINCIQTEVMEYVLDEVTEHVCEENAEAPDFRLILNAMKYLPFINSADVITQKLLDMVEIGTLGAQLEILNSIPEIIPDSQHESTAKQLTRILENNRDLTSAIIDCLNSLNLSNDMRLEIQQYIIQTLLGSASIDVYPVLFDFLTTDCKPINLPSVLLKCRDTLNEIMRNEQVDTEKESKKVVIMNKLHMSVSLKVQYEGWMNLLINIRNFNSSHKPIDIIIMVMLHSTGVNRKRSIEALIKKHVKTGSLKKQHLEAVFEKFFIKQIFRDYLSSIIEIASSLLRGTADLLSVEFGSAIFTLLFENENVDRVQRQDILHTLILLTSSWEAKSVGDILKILLELSRGKQLKHHTVQLMGLSQKTDSLELKDVKQVFELLCYMTCNNLDEIHSGLKDELRMLVRKQISTTKKHLKQRGIIASIVMAKHIAATSENDQEEPDEDESLSDISNLPTGVPQESASLLEQAREAASSIPELMGLYYDQLAVTLMKAPQLDKHFLKWLQENVRQEFENTYTIKEIPNSINDISQYSQYCLNDESEIEEGFSMDIAGLTMKQSHDKPVTLLAPLFRMFRILCNKNLDAIDALLGCGVVLPELEDFNLYDSWQRRQVADCIFHCINWFRESISAFIRHKNKKLRMKLLTRLVHLVELEGKLNKCMEQIPDHKLPSSYFYSDLRSAGKGSPIKTKSETKITRPRKKLKTTNGNQTIDFLNETVASSVLPTQKKKTITAPSKRSAHQIPKPDFREIDTDLLILLKYDLNFSDAELRASPYTTINITAFQYLIDDVVGKLNLIVNNRDLGMSNLNEINPINLITDCVNFAPKVFNNFKEISKEIAKLIELTEREDDHVELYSTEAKILKKSFCLTLEYFMLLFSWGGFGNSKNLPLLRECLRAIVDEETSSQSVTHLTREVTNKLITCAGQCLHLQPAVHLVRALQALYGINTENVEIKKKIAAVSGKFLNKKWYNTSGDLDSGKIMYEHLDKLIVAYLDSANIKTISGIVATLQKQSGTLSNKDDYLEMLESINKTSFHVLYRNLCHYTLDRIKIEITSLTNKQHLILWKTTATIMQGLMNTANAQSTKSNYIAFLKNSIGILKVFLSHGIPILEIMLKSKTDEVLEILKTLQTTTRFLHHLCCTSKLTKDGGIVALVPQFKQTLETLIFRVKAALVANDCSEAFWLGTLKNKDLDGEEILTQPSVTTDGSERNDEEEDELPPDDSDEDILEEPQPSTSREDRSASEVYD